MNVESELLRPPEATLDGYSWLPRMLDKARASSAGIDTGYPFGCPIDHTCMANLGIGPELVLELVARHGSDDAAILEALREHGIPPAEEARFDGGAIEEELQRGGPYLRVRSVGDLLLDDVAGGRVFAGEEHGAGVTLVVIDAAPGYRQAPQVHPGAVVAHVHAGSAKFHLDGGQARIVTAGQVARIPAGVAHWLENSGSENLHATLACTAGEASELAA